MVLSCFLVHLGCHLQLCGQGFDEHQMKEMTDLMSVVENGELREVPDKIK